MAENKDITITEGLGITDESFETSLSIASNSINSNNLISDAMIETALNVREGELGECNTNLSNYEKKLVLTGFLLGLKKIERDHEMMMKSSIMGIIGGIAGFTISDSDDEEND
jgi:hypothetical protein